MRVGGHHLGYCTNIHPADGWDAVLAALRAHGPAVRELLGEPGPLGLGLRLSGRESEELLAPGRLGELKTWLDEAGLYVFTINGFPYGAFHDTRVKDQVHAPDWRTEERVAYTLRLVEILAVLLPEGEEGSISTTPLSYMHWFEEPAAVVAGKEAFAANLARAVEACVRTRRLGGPLIHLDIEPEADGLLADCAELEAFFLEHLLTTGADALKKALDCRVGDAQDLLREHVRVCFDACHAAVAFEDPEAVLDRLDAAGIRVGKVQLSSALRVPLGDAEERRAAAGALGAFADEVYLHQVTQRNADGTLVHFADLPEALPSIGDPAAQEWRIHFHVPIFVEDFEGFGSTQPQLRQVLELVRERGVARHLEVETYTWDVLPEGLKEDLTDSIGRELAWVLDVLR